MKKTIIIKEIKPPFSFELTVPSIFPWEYSKGICTRAMKMSSGQLALVSVRSVGTVENPKLEISIESGYEISSKDMDEVKQKIRWVFDLDKDIKDFYRLAEKDRVLRDVVQNFYGMRAHSEPTVFETVILCICEQQVNLRLARKMRELLIKKFGERLKLEDKVYYAFPSPGPLANATIEELRKCKLSRYKAGYIKGISKAIVQGELACERLKELSNDEVLKKLTRFKGVGRWTAEYVLVRSLRRWEVFPADDLAARKAISEFYFHGRKLSGAEVRHFAQRWGADAGLAVFYLLVAYRHKKTKYKGKKLRK